MEEINIRPDEDLYALMTANMDQYAQVRVKFNKLEDAEEKYGKLQSFKTALEQEKVLTVNIALECDALMGNNDMACLCFGDEAPAQKYEMAMEAIHLGLAALLASMAAAVTAIIIYAINHFRGSEVKGNVVDWEKFEADKLKFKQQMIEHARKDAELMDSEVLKELDAALRNAKRVTKNYGKSVATESAIPDHAGYVRPLSALEADHLSSGEYTRAMMETLKVVDASAPMQVLEDARHAYRELIKAGESEMGKPADPEHISALKQHYMQLMARPRRVHAAIMEALNKVMKKQHDLESGNVKFPEGLNQALRTFTEAVSSREIGFYAKNRGEMVRELEYMREEAQKAQKLFANESKQEQNAGKGNFSTDLTKHSRELLRELHGLLAVMLKVDLLFKRYWKSLDGSAKYLHHVVSTVRWNTALKLRDSGHSKQSIDSNADIQRMDNIMVALDNFRKRAA